MCGIAGLVNLGGAQFDPWLVRNMANAIAHRGPNDAGYVFLRSARPGRKSDSFWVEFCDDAFRHQNEHLAPLGGEYARRELSSVTWDVAFASRRLSILDLSHYGHQPMSNADRTLWMVYNGETYNFQELRSELAARGHYFRSRTDSEVVLHLYEEYGDGFVERLNGMFALAIWDRRRNRLLCARDRYGVKPFYYAVEGGFFLFGSEIKAILASGLVGRAINPEALPEYFTFQNMLSEQTLFRGVRSLPPASVLTLDLSNAQPCIRRYWGFDFSGMRAAAEVAEGRCADDLADLVEQAVRRQLVADVTVGSYLSGGMDSGSIVACASRHIPRLYTFTTGFDLSSVSGIESGFDERAKAEKLASHYQTEHYEMVIHAGDMAACLPRLVWHLEDLRVGNCYQNSYAAKLASRFVRVCLAGAGGDELFGGYPWRYRAAVQADTTAAFDELYYGLWERLVPDSAKAEFFSEQLLSALDRPAGRPYFDELLARSPAARVVPGAPRFSANLTRALWFELNTFLPGILCVEDRVSMSHSLEVRVPFLDNDLVDYALTIPNEYRVSATGEAAERAFETAAGKQILRKAMARVLPAETVNERKQGFSPPDDNWYRGPNMNYLRDVLLDPLTLGRGWFAPSALERIIQDHSAGRVNHRLLIWSLLCFEWLQRVLVDDPPYRLGGAES